MDTAGWHLDDKFLSKPYICLACLANFHCPYRQMNHLLQDIGVFRVFWKDGPKTVLCQNLPKQFTTAFCLMSNAQSLHWTQGFASSWTLMNFCHCHCHVCQAWMVIISTSPLFFLNDDLQGTSKFNNFNTSCRFRVRNWSNVEKSWGVFAKIHPIKKWQIRDNCSTDPEVVSCHANLRYQQAIKRVICWKENESNSEDSKILQENKHWTYAWMFCSSNGFVYSCSTSAFTEATSLLFAVCNLWKFSKSLEAFFHIFTTFFHTFLLQVINNPQVQENWCLRTRYGEDGWRIPTVLVVKIDLASPNLWSTSNIWSTKWEVHPWSTYSGTRKYGQ